MGEEGGGQGGQSGMMAREGSNGPDGTMHITWHGQLLPTTDNKNTSSSPV